MLENTYTGERLGVFSTPNGAHIVRKPNGREEWHRGTLDSCRAFMERLAANPEAVGWRWEITVNDGASAAPSAPTDAAPTDPAAWPV